MVRASYIPPPPSSSVAQEIYENPNDPWQDKAFHLWKRCDAVELRLSQSEARVKMLEKAGSTVNEEICQTLGKALGYPWIKDDQKNFPGATESDGVCVGEHVAESIAAEAARKISQSEAARVAAAKAAEDVVEFGKRMSNICYNLKQWSEAISEDAKKSMEEAQAGWDRALPAYRAALSSRAEGA